MATVKNSGRSVAPTAPLNLSVVTLEVSLVLVSVALTIVIPRPVLTLSVDVVVVPDVLNRLLMSGPLTRLVGSTLSTLRPENLLNLFTLLLDELFVALLTLTLVTVVSVVSLIAARELTSVACASERNLTMPTWVTEFVLDAQSAIALMSGGPLFAVVVLTKLLVKLLGTTMTRLI